MKAALFSMGSVSSKRVVEAMANYFSEVIHYDIRKVEMRIGKGDTQLFYDGEKLENDFKCVYLKSSFRYALVQRALATFFSGNAYMPIKPSAFTIVNDKIFTHLALEKNKIPTPETYITPTVDAAKKLLKSINFPIILKIPGGTHGKGVMFAESVAAASGILDTLEGLKQSVLLQEYIETEGTDIRAIVVGDKVVGSMVRKAAKDEKRSNLHSGGMAEIIELDSKSKQIAIKTAKALNCHICGVDILESLRGPLILEANLSPGLQGIMEATGRNIADDIAKYLYEETVKFHQEKHEDNTAENIIEEVKGSAENQIISQLDFRGERILLSQLVSKMSGFGHSDDVVIKVKKGSVSIQKS